MPTKMLSGDGRTRRAFLAASVLAASTLSLPVWAVPVAAPLEGVGGVRTRVEGIGGAFDLTTSAVVTGSDVVYPAAMAGPSLTWRCRRAVVSTEGDKEQAEVAWRTLGGTGPSLGAEAYDARFVVPPTGVTRNAYTNLDGVTKEGAVSDRAFELNARLGNDGSSGTTWDVTAPDTLTYTRGTAATELKVVQRKVDLPNEQGFGSNELYRVTTRSSKAGGVGGGLVRAVRVQRKFRRAFDADGNRIIEGIEIVKTYRVLDNIAGVEMPTSTTKSQIVMSEIK